MKQIELAKKLGISKSYLNMDNEWAGADYPTTLCIPYTE